MEGHKDNILEDGREESSNPELLMLGLTYLLSSGCLSLNTCTECVVLYHTAPSWAVLLMEVDLDIKRTNDTSLTLRY